MERSGSEVAADAFIDKLLATTADEMDQLNQTKDHVLTVPGKADTPIPGSPTHGRVHIQSSTEGVNRLLFIHSHSNN